MGVRVVASQTQDETVARRAIQAGLAVLQDSGLKGDGPAVDWSRVDFQEFRQCLEAARLEIRRTMRADYHRRELRTKSYHGLMLDLPELLLISAVQAWLAGGNAFQIHPFSASSYTWLAVSTFVAMRQLEDEHGMVRLDILEPDA
jgi:hypothetical protein